MSHRVIAIGDIHGCAPALRKLMEVIDPQQGDVLITLGDCVDRGPDSREVIDILLSLRERCRLVPLMGNHEEMLLNFLDGRPQPDNWLLCGGKETLDSYTRKDKQATIPRDHIDFIRSWVDYAESQSHFFVHGGYHPDQRLSDQRWQLWRWHSLREMIPGRHVSGKTAVVGHTSLKDGEVLDVGHLVCIDTYCWGGGWLTGLDTTTGAMWQVDREGRLRE
jgi:serine/threonine protein phosphatase 1